MAARLTKENAFVFRITHIENMPWIIKNGLHCRNSPVQDPSFRCIGDPDLIEKRDGRSVPCVYGGSLSDYVPFYFTSHSPMLYKIKTGHGVPMRPMKDIVILASSLHHFKSLGVPFVFTDRHAYLQSAKFSDDLQDLDRIDWSILVARDFQRDINRPEKVENYQAEALVHRHVPMSTLMAVLCYCGSTKARVSSMPGLSELSLEVVANPRYFF